MSNVEREALDLVSEELLNRLQGVVVADRGDTVFVNWSRRSTLTVLLGVIAAAEHLLAIERKDQPLSVDENTVSPANANEGEVNLCDDLELASTEALLKKLSQYTKSWAFAFKPSSDATGIAVRHHGSFFTNVGMLSVAKRNLVKNSIDSKASKKQVDQKIVKRIQKISGRRLTSAAGADTILGSQELLTCLWSELIFRQGDYYDRVPYTG